MIDYRRFTLPTALSVSFVIWMGYLIIPIIFMRSFSMRTLAYQYYDYSVYAVFICAIPYLSLAFVKRVVLRIIALTTFIYFFVSSSVFWEMRCFSESNSLDFGGFLQTLVGALVLPLIFSIIATISILLIYLLWNRIIRAKKK